MYLVLNAGCKEKDVAHIGQHLKWFKVREATACRIQQAL